MLRRKILLFVTNKNIHFHTFLGGNFKISNNHIIDALYNAYYGAEGGVLELLETGAPYAPHVKAKLT